jgi:hypothetical protein
MTTNSWWSRLHRASDKWRREPKAVIIARFHRHARRCARGCRTDGGSMCDFELKCWTGAVLYDALEGNLDDVLNGARISRW